MKKIILSIAMISSVSFTSCSADSIVEKIKEELEIKCQECTLKTVVSNVCDNGDGSITVTVGDVGTNVVIGYNEYIAAQKTAGATCK